jgi:hypothetical protein
MAAMATMDAPQRLRRRRRGGAETWRLGRGARGLRARGRRGRGPGRTRGAGDGRLVSGRRATGFDARERAYAAYRHAGRAIDAARVAIALAWDYRTGAQERPPVSFISGIWFSIDGAPDWGFKADRVGDGPAPRRVIAGS